MLKIDKQADWIAAAIFGIAAISLFIFSAPHSAFWWQDAPRHALNGALIRDMLVDLPLSDPRGYAVAYYLKYPALTILFYPPLFAMAEGLMFLLFGVSANVAQATVSIFAFMAAYAAYLISLRSVPRFAAIGVGLALLGIPEIMLWERQIMLDIPALALLLWAVHHFLRFLDSGTYRSLGFALCFMALAMYTKLNTGFMLPVFLILLLMRRPGDFRHFRIWQYGLSFLISIIPLAVMTLKFGQLYVRLLTGGGHEAMSRASLENWLVYAKWLPDLAGWILLTLAIIGLAATLVSPVFRGKMADLQFFALWFVLGYIIFSGLDAKEPRHLIVLLLPLLLLAVHTIVGLLDYPAVKYAILPLAAVFFIFNMATGTLPIVEGHAAAAESALAVTPDQGRILFHGYRDGAFIFNLRANPNRRDVSVIRSDKLLVNVVMRRADGLTEVPMDKAGIRNLFRDYAIDTIVFDPDFWSDLKNFQMLKDVLLEPTFIELKQIPVVSNVPISEKRLIVYRYVGERSLHPKPIGANIGFIGQKIGG
jgi:hypothetical protein